MKYTISLFILIAVTFFFVGSGIAADNKYVGVKTCSMCHKSDAKGNQLKVWNESAHAKAFTTLTSEASAKIAKEKGLKKPASESPECLTCHAVTADAKLLDKGFDVKDGVQCESCHGAGSNYKAMGVMKDKVKAIAAGLTEYKDEAAIEKQCKTCHNEKSPTFKEFKFKTMWDKIKHPAKKS
ncbi:MAG: cytochrome C554 [Chlorobiaceae bacterium]|nr:cytochrome C554 [Chlorobiaceae bacterium]